MKEKILALLDSTHLNDILIAIQLAYKLPFEEFDEIFDKTTRTQVTPEECYYFIRANKIYFWGSAYLGRSEADGPDYESLCKRLDPSEYINLTPKTE